jgi:hypothetical protein
MNQMSRSALTPSDLRQDSAADALAFVGGLFMGAIVGALIAIFLAPSDGQALRARLKSLLGIGPLPGADEPLLTPGHVAAEERVADQRLPAYSH